ncbi:hypothetical protein VE02_07561 [Pseudogymnoascus sp. 03VT05]|nr:hypothetical protein VE02_07561 [Pseudogymnoascus sp. 03VT05]
MHGYLAQEWVLSALGVPVNFTTASPAVGDAFDSTGDINRAGSMQAVAYLLDSLVKEDRGWFGYPGGGVFGAGHEQAVASIPGDEDTYEFSMAVFPPWYNANSSAPMLNSTSVTAPTITTVASDAPSMDTKMFWRAGAC